MSNEQNQTAEGGPLQRGVRPDPERAAFEAWATSMKCPPEILAELAVMGDNYGGSGLLSGLWAAWCAGSAWRREYGATPDQIIELSEALQVRRILEEIKKVAALHPASELRTPFQSAWRLCCEEIFYRATGEQWHMDEDEHKFKRGPDGKPRA